MGGEASKLAAAKSANAAVGSLGGKQALVFGGTSGIGRALGERLAAGGADVTIVGRNEAVGKEIVAGMAAASPNRDAKHSFLKADVSLMENCVNVVKEFEAAGAERLDYVVYCQTKATLQGRTPTKEGIDEKLALNYYSRVFLTNLLAPLLEATAKRSNGDPRVMSVLSAGFHKPYKHYTTDPYLVDHYTQSNAADITSFYTDLWVDQSSQDRPSVTFVHVAPGFVNTNWGSDMPGVLKGGIRVIQACAAKSASDCAELLLPGLISPALKGGFRLLNEYSEPAKKKALHIPEAIATVHKDTHTLLQKFYPANCVAGEGQ